MGVNKVVYNTKDGAITLIDLTSDTVTPDTLAEGVTAHDASGNLIVGRMVTTVEWDDIKDVLTPHIGLGVHTDGKVYVFIDDEPVGEGIICTVYHSITNNLTHCTNSNNQIEIRSNESYTATISANSSCELSSIVVTMGGVDITSSAVSGNTINIANVTGNIVINAVAIQNLFDKNDTDVLLTGRFNSSKAVVAYAEGQLVTGYIEAKVGDTFTVVSDKSAKTNGYTGEAVIYDANKAYITMGSQKSVPNQSGYWTFSNDGLTSTITILDEFWSTDMGGTRWIRFCIAYNDIDSIVITKS